jgi:hypothetical protein
MTPVRLLVVLVSAAAVLFAAAGCGGGGGDGNGDNASATAPDEWASTICGALQDWAQSLQSGSQALAPALQRTKNLENVKESFVGFLEDAEKSSQTLVNKVESAGPPETDEGEAIQRQLVAALEKVQKSFAGAVDRAEELPTEGVQSFRDGVGKISTDVENNLQATGAFFNGMGERSTEVNEAIDNNSTCQQFANAG